LTLTTCTPIIKPPGSDYDRLIVRAKLIDSLPVNE
jgi:sortase (surface protein transpeptidase)